MKVIEVNALPNGAHRNAESDYLLPGWVEIPETMEIPETFPFVSLTVSGGVLTGMRYKVMPIPDMPAEIPPTEVRLDALESDMAVVKAREWHTVTYTVNSSNVGRDVVMLNLAPDVRDMIVKVSGTMDSNRTLYFTLAVDGRVDTSLELYVTFANDVAFRAGNDGGLMSGYVKRNANTATEKVATETTSSMMGQIKTGSLTGFRLGESQYLKAGSIVEVIYR